MLYIIKSIAYTVQYDSSGEGGSEAVPGISPPMLLFPAEFNIDDPGYCREQREHYVAL